ncbi:hypothetical protein P9130_03480 [Bacillus thuringiensis]|nr:hypothetical protein [Bacillus thuringiensis]MEB4892969.1 hypothetical protein [Bacillus thuringiensis]MEC2747215.1 hypothetical protein [Bacillus thuringiensis]MEC2797300.1 hypothetical protein [Bacillus thuringiensis]MEC2818826.1 hypothetical protein [Bacillus thuringiensis]MEC2840393.1 hypothetical protein [Bacillus thuringiensis]
MDTIITITLLTNPPCTAASPITNICTISLEKRTQLSPISIEVAG